MKTYTITAPNAEFNGTSAGVQFKDGRGRGTKAQAARLAVRGYSCPAIEEEVIEATETARRSPAPTSAVLGTDAETKAKAIDELMQIKGIGEKTADKIRAVGVPSLRSLAIVDVDGLARALDEKRETVGDWKDQAQKATGLNADIPTAPATPAKQGADGA